DPVNRIAADADAGGLSEPDARQLVDRLIRERTAARDDTDAPGLENMTRHDADFALAGSNHSWTVRPEQARRPAFKITFDPDHVHYRHAFGDRDDEVDAGIRRLHHRVGGERRRHVDHARVGAGFRHRL